MTAPKQLELAIFAVGKWAIDMSVEYLGFHLTRLEDLVAECMITKRLDAGRIVDTWITWLPAGVTADSGFRKRWDIATLESYIDRALKGELVK